MNPSQNPSALRSKRVITETLLLLMKKYPYQEITVKHIILESGISRKTFYRNFLSKDDVLNSYLDSVLYEYFEALKALEEYHILQMLNIIFPFCEKNRELLFMLRDNDLLYLLLMKLNQLVPIEHEKIVHKMSKDAFITTNLLPEYILFFNIGAIWNILVCWIKNDMRDSVADVEKTIMYYISNIGNIDLRNI